MAYEFGYFFFYALLLAFLAQSAWIIFRVWRRRSPRRTAAINATLVVLSVLTTFVAAEGFFYFFVDTTDGAMHTLTSLRWMVRHLPQPSGTYRGRPLPGQEPAEEPRYVVAVVGDSVTYGQGVERQEDLYPSLLERRLREGGLDAVVYNLSFMGWDTFEEWRALREAAYHMPRLDLVILGQSFNDISPHAAFSPAFFVARGHLTTPPAFLEPLVRRSFLASWLYNRLVWLCFPVLREDERAIAAAHRDPAAFAAYSAELKAFKELTDELGAQLLAVAVPNCSGPWEDYPDGDIPERLVAFWRSLGVPAVSLLEDFRRYPYRRLQAGSLDGHPNALAHRIAAERILRTLVEEGLLPGGGSR